MSAKVMSSRRIVPDAAEDGQVLGCSGVAPEYLADIADSERIMCCLTLVGRLEEVWLQAEGNADKARPNLLKIFKSVFKSGSEEIRTRFLDGTATGTQTVRAQAYLVDGIIHALMELASKRVMPFEKPRKDLGLATIAVGGYGRSELSPHSDIDLLFLLPGGYHDAHYERVVEYVLYMLWDLGLKVGHSTRTIGECIRQAKDDLTVKTALLEARMLWGDADHYKILQQSYEENVISGTESAFIDQKLQERNERHERAGISRYVLEPNVKESKGGLRDLHTLFWVAKYTYSVDSIEELVDKELLTSDAVRTFIRAQNFLWTVRCHMHYLTNRAEDRLTFDLQPEVARLMGYQRRGKQKDVERFMKHYFLVAQDVGNLTRMICSLLEEDNKRRPRFSFSFSRTVTTPEGFIIEKNRLNIKDLTLFAREPVMIMRMFHTLQEKGLNMHPNVLLMIRESLSRVKKLRKDPEANHLFLEILAHKKNSEVILRKMAEAGVFGVFFPPFGHVMAQMQFDMYHVYTTDEHTMRTIGIMHDIELGMYKEDMSLATRLFPLVDSRRALYVAMLLHDLGKGSGEDHSVVGARMALEVGPRLGLSAEETETVSWLVRYHLLMSDTAFKRDLDDPKAISDFADQVQSRERLRLLYLLTCCDIRGVGPQIWNAWKGQLLSALYHRTMDHLTGGLGGNDEYSATTISHLARQQEQAAKDDLRQRLVDWSEDEIEAFLSRGYRSYWYSFTPDDHERHARIIHAADAKDEKLTVDCRINRETNHTEVLIYTLDHPGLFTKISGAMVMASASILDARIATFADGMAVDVFTIQSIDGKAYTNINRIKTHVTKVLRGDVFVAREVQKRPGKESKRTSAFDIPARVLIDNTASVTHTLIEINGRDRPGLVFDVAATLTDLGLQINSAHISTYGIRVVDVFYVKDVFGMKVTNVNKLKQVRQALVEAIEPPDEDIA
jgi:[protein-PII] uridylyltransferase